MFNKIINNKGMVNYEYVIMFLALCIFIGSILVWTGGNLNSAFCKISQDFYKATSLICLPSEVNYQLSVEESKMQDAVKRIIGTYEMLQETANEKDNVQFQYYLNIMLQTQGEYKDIKDNILLNLNGNKQEEHEALNEFDSKIFGYNVGDEHEFNLAMSITEKTTMKNIIDMN